MSDNKSELQRTYTIPLSRAWIAPRHRRTKRAVHMVREFAEKHMKSSEIKLDTELNELLWQRGITKPPRRITVEMSRDEDGIVTISLPAERKAHSEEEEKTGSETPVEENKKGKEISAEDSTAKATDAAKTAGSKKADSRKTSAKKTGKS